MDNIAPSPSCCNCKGVGLVKVIKKSCRYCDGTGKITDNQYQERSPSCFYCVGSGRFPIANYEECSKCIGSGSQEDVLEYVTSGAR
jgi:DnaJ-class molecular chaperone